MSLRTLFQSGESNILLQYKRNKKTLPDGSVMEYDGLVITFIMLSGKIETFKLLPSSKLTLRSDIAQEFNVESISMPITCQIGVVSFGLREPCFDYYVSINYGFRLITSSELH